MPITLDQIHPQNSPPPPPRGTLALIGGRFEPDNDRLFAALRDASNGRIAVLSMASGYPEEVGEETVEDFRAQGFYAELVPIFFETRDHSPFDPALIERLRAFGSVFFTGGDQSRITGTLVQDGVETPALAAIRELYREGGLIAGSSAGAAIMSGPMILGGTSLHALSRGIDDSPGAEDDFDAFRLGAGLGFFRYGMVDQHFLARGRIGRLICAAHLSGETLAYGIDENSALLVQGTTGTVVGETGVLLVDLRKARMGHPPSQAQGIRLSYLDDGDSVDLVSGKALPAADKKRVRPGRFAYRTPAPVKRNAFAGYGLHDLMLRLVESDPKSYRTESAAAYDHDSGTLITLTLERKPRKSRALKAIRHGEVRYTALDFQLDIGSEQRMASPLPARNEVLRPEPTADAQLILLGNNPGSWDQASRAALLARLPQPIGLLPTASGEPKAMLDRYTNWLDRAGVRYEVLPISLSNIERVSRDRALLRKMESMGSLLLTGGDQRRLTEALLHCSEATPVLHQLVTAYERGVPIAAVAAAATALGDRMIAEGDSVAALRYGSSEDASGAGVIVEQGIGLTGAGLIDQHFIRRHRIGRLLMACAEQKQPFGFGLAEGSGLILHGNSEVVEAIGQPGVVVASLDPNRVRFAPGQPDPEGIQLACLAPGVRVPLSELAVQHPGSHCLDTELLERALDDLARDYVASGMGGAVNLGDWRITVTSAPRA